ncbi:ABC transporter permease [Tamlana agarivorans]|uniref:ABC transporter permease n=1 Tax=Pseudotamlana agarivorans TaxID=481183 RepID=A0ACC5U646_9FLAO|nr:ABC transporter permease [Tamlana agarivorans]MBU2949770.1 ABC transporter permease [Tamlana agarivorans]
MRGFLNIIIREVLILKKRPTAWILIFLIPTAIFFYLGYIYKEGAINTVDIGVLDLDHSGLSRTVIKSIEATPKLNIVKFLNSNDNIDEVFVKNPEIRGFYVIPNHFEKVIYRGEQAKLLVYTNSSNIVYGNLIYKEAASFINTLSAGINYNAFRSQGIPSEKALKMIAPIKVNTKPLFNAYYNYLYYLLPGLTTVLLQMLVFLLAARSINSEYSNASFDEVLGMANGSVFKLIFAKLTTYTVIGFIVGLFIFAVVHPLLGIPASSGTLAFLPVVFLFVMVNAMLGIMVSAIFKNEAIAMDVSFVYNSPAFVFSGFTFPIMAMPAFNAWYAQLIPYTHFLSAFIKGIEMHAPFQFLVKHLLSLALFFAIGYVVTAIILFLRNQKRSV